jgi:plasmid stabilization system protein ParE
MRIRWTPAATTDLQHISDYLKDHHPHYRQASLRKLYDTIRALKQLPGRGRPGREQGTREILFLPLPYVAVYRVKDESVEILRIYHAAQDRP